MTSQNKEGARTPLRTGFLIHDVSRLRRTIFDQKLKPLGITRSQWWLLANLSRAGDQPLAQVELARLLDVGKVTLGGLVDRLEANELVQRVPDPEDRRSKRVRMTRKGAALLRRLESVALVVNDDIMAGVTPAEEDQLRQILTRMKRNLKAMDAVPSSAPRRAEMPTPS